MVSKKEALNSKTKESSMRTEMSKIITCWYCHMNGRNIIDKFNCCKRCGTNLKKYPTRESHPYPDLDDEKIAKEVLGTREKCDIRDDNHYDEEVDPSKLPIKYNPLQIIVHFKDKEGNLQQRRLDPVRFQCGRIATHLLERQRKNGTKLYLCDECYDENPEWEIID